MAKLPGTMKIGDAGPKGANPVFFLLVVLLVMIGALVWLFGLGGERDRKIPVSLREGREEIKVSPDVVPWDPKTETWGPVSDMNRDGQRETPVRALQAAAERVSRHAWNAFSLRGTKLTPERIGFQRMDIPNVFASPRVLRGQPLEVVGTLRSLEEVDVFDKYAGMKIGKRTKAWEGVIQPRESLHGSEVPVFFTLVDEVEDALPAVGAPVKLQGVFFKLHEITLADPVVGVWMLGKRLSDNFIVPEVAEIDLGLLENVKDVKEAQNRQLPLYEEAFWHLVADVIRRPDRDRGEPIDVSRKQSRKLVTEPEKYRGEFVTLKARVLRVDSVGLNVFFPTNAEGDNPVDRVWSTYLTADGATPLTVMWLKEPNLDLNTSDEVIVNAVFYRLWGFKTKNGWKRGPLLIGVGDMEIYEPDTSGASTLAIGFLIFGAFCVVLLFFVLRADHKRAELFRKSLNAKKRFQRGRVDLNEVARQDGESS